jgi:hypothetical protein
MFCVRRGHETNNNTSLMKNARVGCKEWVVAMVNSMVVVVVIIN